MRHGSRLIVFTIAVLTSGLVPAEDRESKAAIADCALRRALENLAVLSYFQNGNEADLPDLASINLHAHLAALRQHGDAISDPDWIAAKIRTLNAIGLIWENSPPITDIPFKGAAA